VTTGSKNTLNPVAIERFARVIRLMTPGKAQRFPGAHTAPS
jgi:hypothetical protein